MREKKEERRLNRQFFGEKKAPTDVSVNHSFHGYGWQKIHNSFIFFGEKTIFYSSIYYHYFTSEIC